MSVNQDTRQLFDVSSLDLPTAYLKMFLKFLSGTGSEHRLDILS